MIISLVHLVAAVFLSAAPVPEPLVLQQDLAACAQISAPWCHTGESGSAGRDLTAEEIYHVANTVHYRFIYKDDGKVDTWTPKPVIALVWLRGPCVDLAETTLAVFALLGVPHDHMARLIVSTVPGGHPDHMVGLIKDSLGRVWVVGDTIAPPRLRYALDYDPILLARVSDGVFWTEL